MLAGESPKPTQALLTQAKPGQAKPTKSSFASYGKAKQTEQSKQSKPSKQSKANQATQLSKKKQNKAKQATNPRKPSTSPASSSQGSVSWAPETQSNGAVRRRLVEFLVFNSIYLKKTGSACAENRVI